VLVIKSWYYFLPAKVLLFFERLSIKLLNFLSNLTIFAQKLTKI